MVELLQLVCATYFPLLELTTDIPNVTKHHDSNGKKVLDLNKAVKESLPSFLLIGHQFKTTLWDEMEASCPHLGADMICPMLR